jgi:SNF2 family DNA or RNA helicase
VKHQIEISDNQIIILQESELSKVIFLSAKEVFKLLINKEGIDRYNISKEISSLSFRKIPLKASLIFGIENDTLTKEVTLTNYRESFNIFLDNFLKISFNNYLIIENVWYPIIELEREHLNEINDRLNADNWIFQLPDILTVYDEILNQSWSSDQFRTLALNNVNFSKSKLFERDLYGYQEEGLKWMQYCCIRGQGTILGDDMGLGKTAQIIALISWAIEQKTFAGILIIVPSTLLENWRREFEFFAPRISTLIHHGNQRSGSIAHLLEYDVVITSYSMVINDYYLLNKHHWNLMIADEASLLKNSDSERRKYLGLLKRDTFIAMTGTPVENSLLDLWSLVDLVVPSLLETRDEFAKKYIKNSIENTILESDLENVKNKINPYLIRRKKEDVLDNLPERIDIHQALEMSSFENIAYNRVREEIINQSNGKSISEIFVLIQKLRQFTSHPFLLDKKELEFKSNLHHFTKHSVKLKRTIEILNEIKENHEKVLIFTEYLDMIDLLSNLLNSNYKIPTFTIDGRIQISERQSNIDAFSSVEGFAVMILNPKTAGMGLNITAANHVIHYTRQWNPALEEQATARAYRNKQSKPVNIYYLYYANSIEEYIDNRLRQKTKLSKEVITVNTQELTIGDLMSSLELKPK